MAIDQGDFRLGWIRQTEMNCGSCCVASIVNYARRKGHNIGEMDANAYVGLAVGGIRCLGSVSVGLYQYLTFTYPNVFDVEEVEIENKMAHWGGALNRVRGGKSPRGSINPNTAYFSGHEHRFLLREFSAYVVLGHFIIQTDENHFWDPNRSADVLPLDLTTTKDNYHGRAISQRADALQIDVRPA